MTERAHERHVGKIKLWDLEKGYAIVEPESGGDDAFVLRHSIEPTRSNVNVDVGVEVQYEDGLPLSPAGIRAFCHSPDGLVWGTPVPPGASQLLQAGGEDDWLIPQMAPHQTPLEDRLRDLEAKVQQQTRQISELLGADEAKVGLGQVAAEESGSSPEGAVSQHQGPDAPDGLGWLVTSSKNEPDAARAYAAQGVQLEFGRFVRQKRLAAKLSQEQLAEKAGTSVPQISLIERGTGKRGPSLDLVARILWALGLRLEFR